MMCEEKGKSGWANQRYNQRFLSWCQREQRKKSIFNKKHGGSFFSKFFLSVPVQQLTDMESFYLKYEQRCTQTLQKLASKCFLRNYKFFTNVFVLFCIF